ncbi:MAG: hypothetical protein R3C53_05645 [Pirellulaceae bacterium]
MSPNTADDAGQSAVYEAVTGLPLRFRRWTSRRRAFEPAAMTPLDLIATTDPTTVKKALQLFSATTERKIAEWIIGKGG